MHSEMVFHFCVRPRKHGCYFMMYSGFEGGCGDGIDAITDSLGDVTILLVRLGFVEVAHW